jgi:alkylhydroperoxidase family enzyme
MMERLRAAILETPGDTEPTLRKAVESFAAALGGRESGSAVELPDELVPCLDKVAKHAYKVTDEDVTRLRRAGYSEDAIFELTLAAALGATRARLELGLQAMGAGH